MNETIKRPVFNVLRILVGLLFVFSGFVKCIDPVGGAIKIEDYFTAWGIECPDAVALVLSFLQNIVEFMAGFMLVFNLFVPLSSLVAMLFMVFFTPLTLYIAIANPVSDCGCFGDAVKLGNWETFFKNLVFLPMSIAVFVYRKEYKSSLAQWRQMAATCIGVTAALIVSVSGVSNEPIIEFRPYGVGTDIRQAMSIPPDAPQPQYKTTFILEKDGQRKEFDEFNYPYEDSTWVYIDSRTETIAEGYVPPITDFTFTDADGESQTDWILSSTEPITLAISPKVEKISDDGVEKLTKLAEAVQSAGNIFYVATASDDNATMQLQTRAKAEFAFLAADETMLKTITRCNPGVIVIQNGIIVAKYHIDHLPMPGEMASPASSYLKQLSGQNERLIVITIIFAVGILLLPLYKKTHKRFSK